MKKTILKGGLSENMDVVRQAIERAVAADELVPVKKYVDSKHWVFSLRGKGQTPASQKNLQEE